MFGKNKRRAFNSVIIIIPVLGWNNNAYAPRVPSPVVYRVGAHALDFRATPNTLLVPHPQNITVSTGLRDETEHLYEIK